MPPKRTKVPQDADNLAQRWAYVQAGAGAAGATPSPTAPKLKQPPGAGGVAATARQEAAAAANSEPKGLSGVKKAVQDKARSSSPMARRSSTASTGGKAPKGRSSSPAPKGRAESPARKHSRPESPAPKRSQSPASKGKVTIDPNAGKKAATGKSGKKDSKGRKASVNDASDSDAASVAPSEGSEKSKAPMFPQGVAKDGYILVFARTCDRATRKEIEESLRTAGCFVIKHDTTLGKHKVHSIQITAHEDDFCKFAERVGFMKEVMPIPGDKLPWRYIPFHSSQRDKFKMSTLDDHLFLPSERLSLLDFLIRSTLKRKLDDKKLIAKYTPLHDYAIVNEVMSLATKCCSSSQTITNRVRDYCGEKDGIFFAFMDYYTGAIFLPGICGLLAGITIVVCNILGYPLVNTQIVQPAVSMLYCIWGTVFLNKWRRAQGIVAFRWNTLGMSDQGDHNGNRRGYRGKRRRNPVTGEHETYYAPWKRHLFRFPLVTMGFAVMLGITTSIAVLLYAGRQQMQNDYIDPLVFGGSMYGVIVYFINYSFKIVSKSVTDFENHKTQRDWDMSYVYKTFWFQLITSFSFMFYAIFLKDLVALLPFIPEGFKGQSCIFQQDVLVRNDCMTDLRSILTMQYWAHMACQLGTELLIPVLWTKVINVFLRSKVKGWKKFAKRNWRNSGLSKEDIDPSMRWRFNIVVKRGLPAQTMMRKWNVLDEYANFAIQFAYTTLFISAAPFLTLTASGYLFLNNRFLLFKLCLLTQRGFPERVESMGPWFDIFNIIAVLAIFTNSSLISMVMFAAPMGMPRTIINSIFYFLFLEHMLLLIKILLSWLFSGHHPKVKKWLMRQEYEADVGVKTAIQNYKSDAMESGMEGHYDNEGNWVPADAGRNCFLKEADEWFDKMTKSNGNDGKGGSTESGKKGSSKDAVNSTTKKK